jgi:hypothetical protein
VWYHPAETATAVLIPLTITGVDELLELPLPSCPNGLYPQHLIVPFESTAQVCPFLAETATAVLIPLTITGVDELLKLPLPSWPTELFPQHLIVLSKRRAQVWPPPAETATAVLIPLALIGAKEVSVLSLPNWPESFRPQHLTMPSERRAQVWFHPAETFRVFVSVSVVTDKPVKGLAVHPLPVDNRISQLPPVVSHQKSLFPSPSRSPVRH